MKQLFTLVFCFGILSLQAQFNLGYKINDTIPVTINGNQLDFPWAGGINSGQISAIDLNNDDIDDLLIFDVNGETVKTFINRGTANTVDYVHDRTYQKGYPNLTGFVQTRDYNCDGRMDLFTYNIAGFMVHENVTGPNDSIPQWNQVTNTHIMADYGAGMAQAFTIPLDVNVIDDIDNDGDLDMLAFGSGVWANTVAYYRNNTLDSFNSCDSLNFWVPTLCWGGIAESPQNCGIFTGILCKGNSGYGMGDVSGKNRAHAGSSLLTFDIDADGDKELAVGDIGCSTVKLCYNAGDSIVAHVDSVDTLFPMGPDHIDISYFPATYYVDVNNDGVKDLLATCNANEPNQLTDNFWYYENSGADNLPTFNLQNKNLLVEDMIDLGAGNYPVFINIDGDSLMDMLVGNYITNTGVFTDSARLAYFRNVGTTQLAEYELVDSDFGNLSQYAKQAFAPTVGDIDDDGDMDLLVGDREGHLHLFRNQAQPGNPADFVLDQAEYFTIDVGEFATPHWTDVNGDSLLDLIVGERDGTLNYFMNNGSASLADYDSVPNIDSLGGIITSGIFNPSGYSVPCIASLDTTGERYLLVSSVSGTIRVYGDVIGNLNGTFTLLDSIITDGYRVAVSAGEMNGDDQIDLVTGEFSGGMQIWTQQDSLVIIPGFNEPSVAWTDISIFPNPGKDYLTVELTPENSHLLTVEMVDMLGRTIYRKQLSVAKGLQIQETVDIRSLPKGVYVVQLTDGTQVSSRKFVKN